MSQIFVSSTSSPPPPDVPTDFVTDDGTAIASANILNVNGVDSTENNANGIMTRANPNLSNNLQTILTNRLQGTVTTVGAVTGDAVTFALGATPASYTMEILISGFVPASNISTSYWHLACVRTSGIAATIVGTDETFQEDAALGGSDVDSIASANNYILRLTGVAGLTINWSIVGYYVRST